MDKRIVIIFLLIFGGLRIGFPQDIDIKSLEGKWHGTFTYLNGNYPQYFELSVVDDLVTGIARAYKNDSAAYYEANLSGGLKRGKISLSAFEYTIKKGTWCLPLYDLALIEVGSELMLEGRWKPNFVKGGCIIGVSGRISLVKENDPGTVAAIPPGNPPNPDVEEEDVYTREVIKGLKTREYHALIIGIGDYNNETIQDLDEPVNDGQKLKRALLSGYSFEPENMTVLENPMRSEILDQMQRLSESLDDKDNLIIFYAGHGIWDEDLEQGYWLPSDASMDSRSQWISNSTIRDYIRSINTQHTLLISDACFSGGLLKERSVGRAMMNVYNMPSRKAITSGTLTTVPDKSVFMRYLIKYLEENQEPLISADQIFYQMKISVINNSPSSQVPQYGPIHQANDEGGEFVFLKKQ